MGRYQQEPKVDRQARHKKNTQTAKSTYLYGDQEGIAKPAETYDDLVKKYNGSLKKAGTPWYGGDMVYHSFWDAGAYFANEHEAYQFMVKFTQLTGKEIGGYLMAKGGVEVFPWRYEYKEGDKSFANMQYAPFMRPETTEKETVLNYYDDSVKEKEDLVASQKILASVHTHPADRSNLSSNDYKATYQLKLPSVVISQSHAYIGAQSVEEYGKVDEETGQPTKHGRIRTETKNGIPVSFVKTKEGAQVIRDRLTKYVVPRFRKDLIKNKGD